MATGVTSWSTTPSSNASADSSVNWAEGMAPSAVNDSARAEMASVAKWRDDITGVNVTGGSGTAYTLTSSQIITSNVNGFTVQFTPGTTNTGAVTLSVDGQTAKPIRYLTGADLLSGSLISGSLYQATYRTATEEWLLHSFDARSYIVPVGGMIEYTGTVAPNPAFAFPNGQAISRTGYPVLFALIGTTFGTGNGTTTFNIPDLQGRVTAHLDGGTGRLTTTSGMNGTGLGSVGGAQTHTLTEAQLPAISRATSGGGVTGTVTMRAGNVNVDVGASATVDGGTPTAVALSLAFTNPNFSFGSGTAHPIIQPTIALNKILRII